MTWLASTIGKRGYIADYLRSGSPPGSRIVGTGDAPFTVGFAACDRAYRVPSIESAVYVDAVRAVCRAESVDAVLTLSDLDVRCLSRHRNGLADDGLACFFPDADVAETFADKRLTWRRLAEHGLRVPRSWESVDAALHDGALMPLVIKPACGSASTGYTLAPTVQAARLAQATLAQPLVQEFVPGRLVNVEVCSSLEGVPLAGTVWERLGSVAGETTLAVTIDHPEALALVRRVLERFPVPGPIDVDLIEGPDGLCLIEVNTRFGGGYPVSHLAGAAFPELMLESLEGRRPARFDRYRRGVHMMKALAPLEVGPDVADARYAR